MVGLASGRTAWLLVSSRRDWARNSSTSSTRLKCGTDSGRKCRSDGLAWPTRWLRRLRSWPRQRRATSRGRLCAWMVGLAFEQKSALRARSSPRSYEPCRHETVYLLLIEETAMIVPLDDYI